MTHGGYLVVAIIRRNGGGGFLRINMHTVAAII